MSINLDICKDEKEWDAIVDASATNSLYHKWRFLKIMEAYTEKRIKGVTAKGVLYPIIAYNGNEPLGVFPVYHYKFPFGSIALSPPCGTEIINLGPIISDSGLKKSRNESLFVEFQQEADKYISDNLKPYLTILHLQPEIRDSRPFKWDGFSVEPRHTYTFDLRSGPDNIWNGFHSRLRNKIKKSVDDGVVIRDGSGPDLELIHESISKRYSDQGIKMGASGDYIKEVYSEYKDNVKIIVAEKDGKFAGGVINIQYKNKVTSWIGTPRIEGEAANELVLWESIKYACQSGYKCYENMGGDTPKLYRSKTRYNPDLTTYLSCKKYSPSVLKAFEIIYRQIKPRNRAWEG
jgi:hypothetical protein